MVLALFAAIALSDNQSPAQVLYKRAQSAVVTITTPTMAGTGFLVGDGSLAMTCYHVVKADPDQITVKGLGHATLIKIDELNDIAVLKLSKRGPSHLVLSQEAAPTPGAAVFVIGSPLGVLEKSITEGTLSSVRHVGDRALLQITAPISHGSSGSPVLDSKGLVIGMAALTLEKGQGLNFAISAFNLRGALPSSGSSPTKQVEWKYELTVTAEAPMDVYERMDLDSPVSYSGRRFEVFDVARTKFPEWYSTRFLDGNIGFLPAKGTHASTQAEVDAWNEAPAPPPEFVAAIKMLKDGGDPTESVRKLGPKALPYLAYELRNSKLSEDIRFQIPILISSFGKDAEKTITDLYENGNRFERKCAVSALDWISLSADPDSPEEKQLDAFLSEPQIVKIISSAIEDPDTSIFAADIVGTARVVSLHDQMFKLIDVDDGVPDKNIVRNAARIATEGDRERLMAAISDLVDESLKVEKEGDDVDEDALSAALSYLAYGNDTAAHWLTDFLDHSTPLVRYYACENIRLSGDKWFLPSVETVFDDESAVVGAGALYAAVTLKEGGYQTRIRQACEHKEPFVRSIGVRCAGVLKSQEGLSLMMKLLHDSDNEVREALVSSLVECGLPEAKEGLNTLAKDPDPTIRKAAKQALSDLAKKKEDKSSSDG